MGMKSVLISIQPKWCAKIANGEKTVEVRKTRPKLESPFKVYIYCTKDEPLYRSGEKFWCGDDFGNGKVIGEFVCDTFVTDRTFGHDALFRAAACMSDVEAAAYCTNNPMYGWHISDLVIYDKPRELSEFYKPCVFGEDDVSCFLCDKSGYTPDMHIDCFNTVTKPPQSWCYVEEVHNVAENRDSM